MTVQQTSLIFLSTTPSLIFGYRRYRSNLDITLILRKPNMILAPVVQRLDNAIHRINHYPADSVVSFVNTYPLDSDLSGG